MLVTVVVPTGKFDPEAGVLVTVPTPGQLSVAEVVNVTTAPQTPASLLTVMSVGTVSAGFSVSLTVTVNVLVVVLPCASVTVLVTVVVPTGNVEPEAGVLVTEPTPGQLSVAEVVKVTTAPHTPASLLTVMPAGTVNAGFSVSFTVTLKLPVVLLPCASVAVTFTVVVPTANVEPDKGVLTTVTPGQLSAAVGVNVTTAPH